MDERNPPPKKKYMTTSRVQASFYPISNINIEYICHKLAYFSKVAKRKKSLGVVKCNFFGIQHTSKAQTTANW